MRSVIIAGTSSGSGKTTITIAMMRAFIKLNKKIAPFKVGPDYIDPKFHEAAAGTKSYNLDLWMNDEETVKFLTKKHLENKDFGIIEGVMGLYDGYDYNGNASTAHIAKTLNSAVILVVDANGASASIAATISGFKNYDPDINFKGIILNNISSPEFYSSIKIFIKEKTGVDCFGYFPHFKNITFKSRHLGLIPAEEILNINEKIDILSETALKTIDLEKIEKLAIETSGFQEINDLKRLPQEIRKAGTGLKIGIAKDEAFSFYYEDNLLLLKECGVSLINFSPLNDKYLPDSLDGIYLGGGFPEEFGEKLSKNKSMLNDIKEKLENGMPCFAECGGLMYLTNGIKDKNGIYHKTVGFFNCKTIMTEKLQRFGYVEVEFDGVTTKTHEFHHSILEVENADFEFKYKVRKLDKNKEWDCGLFKKNVLAGYPHIHFYSNFDFFKKILELYKKDTK
jgi:cobyrinic acid a,c-diamide synthase